VEKHKWHFGLRVKTNVASAGFSIFTLKGTYSLPQPLQSKIQYTMATNMKELKANAESRVEQHQERVLSEDIPSPSLIQLAFKNFAISRPQQCLRRAQTGAPEEHEMARIRQSQ
jgi:hypothetical protein